MHQAWAATEAVALKTDVVPVPVGSLVVTMEKSKENMLDSEGGKVTSMTEGPLEGSERRNQHKEAWWKSLEGGQQAERSRVRTDPSEVQALGWRVVSNRK